MTKKKVMQFAMQAAEDLKDIPFNDPVRDTGFDLYTFDLNGETLNVFAYIGKQRDEMYGTEWYSVYAGVEYVCGDNIYADYDHSTNGLSTEELADELFALGNLYTKEENLEILRKMTMEGVTAPLRTIPTKKYFTVTARNIDWDIWGDEEREKVDLPSEVTIPNQFATADYEYDYGSFDMDKLRADVKEWLSNRKEYNWYYACDFDLIVS